MSLMDRNKPVAPRIRISEEGDLLIAKRSSRECREISKEKYKGKDFGGHDALAGLSCRSRSLTRTRVLFTFTRITRIIADCSKELLGSWKSIKSLLDRRGVTGKSTRRGKQTITIARKLGRNFVKINHRTWFRPS